MEWSEGKLMLEYCGSQWDWSCPLRDIWKFEGGAVFLVRHRDWVSVGIEWTFVQSCSHNEECLSSICPTGQLCRWKTCSQSYELRSITQCFRVFKFCLLFRVQLISKERNHCINQGMTVLCFVRNFIKGLLCRWQWFCLSFWGHPCKVPSVYTGSWCVHGNFSWVPASDHSFMISSVAICMLRYVSLYCMLPFLYVIYISPTFLDVGHAGEILHLWIDFPTTEMLLVKHIIILIINKQFSWIYRYYHRARYWFIWNYLCIYVL